VGAALLKVEPKSKLVRHRILVDNEILNHLSNPVLTAFTQSLESQISSLRDELAAVYKTHGQNAQRLLAMNETLREREELSRVEAETLRKAREEIATLRRKVDQHAELMSEKDRTVQVSSLYMVSPRWFT
jgi:chromosome segregation ATPase